MTNKIMKNQVSFKLILINNLVPQGK